MDDCNSTMNLKIVGAGELGIRIAMLWKQKFPDSDVFLKTQHDDPDRSRKWRSLGFKPLSCEYEQKKNRVTAPFVVFCAPPTNNPNYVNDITESVSNDWDCNSTDGKAFVFTGSGGVYLENSGGIVDENSEVSFASDKTKMLLSAEQTVLKNEGIVLRLGALYTKTTGAHTFWVGENKNEFSSIPGGWINLVHYDDAARCVILSLLNSNKTETKKLFLVSDGVPMTRQNICEAALKCNMYKNKVMPKFNGDKDAVDGKQYNASLVSETLEWKPKFQSFETFMMNDHLEELEHEN